MIGTIVTHFIMSLIGFIFGTLFGASSIAFYMAKKYDKTRRDIDENNNNISQS